MKEYPKEDLTEKNIIKPHKLYEDGSIYYGEFNPSNDIRSGRGIIIKIQSHVRGMEMRNKIKLKSRNKKLINQNIQNKNEINYESIIVNKIKIFFIKYNNI